MFAKKVVPPPDPHSFLTLINKTMKINTFWKGLIAAITLVSCKKEGDVVPPPDPSPSVSQSIK